MKSRSTSRETVDLGLDLSKFLPQRLGALSRLSQSLLASVLAESGMTVAQWRVYLCLGTLGATHLNGIAQFTHLPQSSLSRSIAKLHEQGVVRNAREESDRRIARIELTPKGRRHLKELAAQMEQACANAFRLNRAEENSLLTTLDSLIDRLVVWLEKHP